MGDYIDRAALGIDFCRWNVFENKSYVDGWNAAVKILKEAPAADVQEIKHGKWIKMYNNPNDGNYYCSECHNGIDIATGKVTPIDRGLLYCPNCGAKMDGGNNNA
jgi:hypothetical protein